MTIELHRGDCLVESSKIPNGSVDLILTDLPYGTVKDLEYGKWADYATGWDVVIDTAKIMQLAQRILRQHGRMVLFAQQPFTTELINHAQSNLPFCYNMIWVKNSFANNLGCKKNPLGYFEDMLMFQKRQTDNRGHPLVEYFQSELKKTGLRRSEIKAILGNNMDSHYFTNGLQFSIPTRESYEKLQTTGCFQKPYSEIQKIDAQFKEGHLGRYKSTFNLWDGKGHKSNVFKYKKDIDNLHPTQKPVALLSDLILTFSDEGDSVVDLTMGSGSTGVAALKTGRNFTGIEMDEGYFDVAQKRIEKTKIAMQQKSLFKAF